MLSKILWSLANVWRVVTRREQAEVVEARSAVEAYLVKRGRYAARSGRERRSRVRV